MRSYSKSSLFRFFYIMLFVICSVPFINIKTYAAEVSPDVSDGWFLLPFNQFDTSGGGFNISVMDFSSDSGTYYNDSVPSASTNWITFNCGIEGGVFPEFKIGETYIFYLTLSLNTNEPFDVVNNLYFRELFTSSNTGGAIPFTNKTLYRVLDTTTVSVLTSYTFNRDWNFSTSSAILLNLNPQVTISGRVSYAFYCKKVESISEAESIISAINNQTEDINNKLDEILSPDGNNNLGNIIEGFDEQVIESLGALAFAESSMQQFINLFEEEPPAPVLTFPEFSMNIQGINYKVWDSYDYDLRTLEVGQLGFLIEAIRGVCSIALWLAFLSYLSKQFEQFWRK